MNNLVKNVAIWLVIALVLMTVFQQFNTRQIQSNTLEYSQFIEEVKAGRVAKVTIEGRVIKGLRGDGKRFVTYSPSDPWLVSDLLKSGVIIEAKPEEEPSLLMNIFGVYLSSGGQTVSLEPCMERSSCSFFPPVPPP